MPDIYVVNSDFSLFVLTWVTGIALLYSFIALVTWVMGKKR